MNIKLNEKFKINFIKNLLKYNNRNSSQILFIYILNLLEIIKDLNYSKNYKILTLKLNNMIRFNKVFKYIYNKYSFYSS